MSRKCEFCGADKNVGEFYECACDEYSEHVFICEKCKGKYLDFIKKNHPIGLPGIISFRQHISLTLWDVGIAKMKKEATTMQVSCKGFIGELIKLEQKRLGSYVLYDLSIYDSEKNVTHSFTGVKMEDVKFLNAEVCFK